MIAFRGARSDTRAAHTLRDGTIGGYGLPAVFVLMLLESMGILIPSEAISPFAGYLVSEGRMTLLAA